MAENVAGSGLLGTSPASSRGAEDHVDPYAGTGVYERADVPEPSMLSAQGKKLSVAALNSEFSRMAGHRTRQSYEQERFERRASDGGGDERAAPPTCPLPPSVQGSLSSHSHSAPPTPNGGNKTPRGRVRQTPEPASLCPSCPSPPYTLSPEQLFPSDASVQDLEVKDRMWLEYRDSERRKQEKVCNANRRAHTHTHTQEDHESYETRLEARLKTHQLKIRAREAQDLAAEEPLVTEDTRSNFRIIVGIDKKKAKEHATMLVAATASCAHPSNQIHLYNCYSKNAAKRGQETVAHLAAIKDQIVAVRQGISVSVASEHVTKDKAQAIIDHAVGKKADLIVLGMKVDDKSFFARKVSPGVVEMCPEGKAVLLVPPPGVVAADPEKPRMILFCCDGTMTSERSLTYLAHVIKKRDKVVILTVVTPAPKLVVVQQSDDRASLQPNANYEAILSQRVQVAEKLVERVKTQLVASLAPDFTSPELIDTELRIVYPGKSSIADIIFEVAKHLNADTIVLGSRCIDGWQKVVQGAVMQSVLATAPRRSILIAK